MMDQDHVVRSLSALAHGTRRPVFRALVGAGKRGLTPGAISAGAGVPAATLSFHLKELAQAGLVTQQRLGRHLVYRASFDHMRGLLGYLTAHCCQGDNCLDESASSCR